MNGDFMYRDDLADFGAGRVARILFSFQAARDAALKRGGLIEGHGRWREAGETFSVGMGESANSNYTTAI